MPKIMVDSDAIADQPLQLHSHPRGVRPDDAQEQLKRIGHIRQYDSGITIVAEGDEPSIIGRVASGVVRITQTLDDGRQQIVGLAMPGEYFGHFFRSGSAFMYEAATDVAACVFPQKPFEALLASHHGLEHTVMMGALRDLELSREWIMVLGCQNTFERVVSFMLHIHKRMRMAGLPTHDRFIEFPIGRRDIAGYLGTTVETISRHVQALARQRIIRILDNSHFEICNLGRLQSLSKQHWNAMAKSIPTSELDSGVPQALKGKSWSQSGLA
ncbi:Crp/Fnr family transcriptional regulator [Ciceribacter sp. T2.26MG-112.2]|uniref:Crp/Fnr family transcriptional regulator n=1 Tax=Ciceribacter sp. T2.26MG-112.2 TaxID=3137154 RepID=UPI0012B6A6DA|nr:Crp/Fnr family transcriptional regulator [Ciceribacter naphthalenivorans]